LEKKDSPSTEVNTQAKQEAGQKRNLKVVQPSKNIFEANLECMEKGFADYIRKQKSSPIAVEDNVSIKGIKNPTCTIILGLATPRVLEQIVNHKEKQFKYIAIIEPDIGIFKQTLERHYLGQFLKDPRIDFLIGIPLEQLRPELHKSMTTFVPESGPRASYCQQPEIIPDPFCFSEAGPYNTELMQALSSLASETARQVFISMGCAPDSFNRFVQTSRNFDNLQNKYSMEKLKDKFNDMPAVIVGAGPSMDNFIDACKKYDLENKSLIIACDASLRRLLKEGIRPHLVTRCERKLTQIFDGVKKEDTKDIFYVAYPWCDPEFFNLFEESFMIYRGNGICNWTGYNHLRVDGGVSSANAALELAWELGCKDAVITGIDLVMIDNKTHGEGTKVEFDIQKSKKKWTQALCNDGKMRTTIPVWNRCFNEYNNSIAKYAVVRKMNIHNTSDRGIKIEGAKLSNWNDLGNLFKADKFPIKKIRKHIVKYGEIEEANFKEIKARSLDILDDIRTDLDEVFGLVDDHCVNAQHEERKIVEQTRNIYDPQDFFKTVDLFKDALETLYKNPCKPIEDFKNKWYTNIDFSNILLDTVQLDVFKVENKSHSLKNIVKSKYIRLKNYVEIHACLFRIIRYYVDQIRDLISGENKPLLKIHDKDILLEVDDR
jgi:hypothetical protein